MENREKAKLLKRILDSQGLPSLSPLAIKLVELAADDRSSARDLAAIIEQDPGLATRLLRLVGSAFFARPQPVTSISQAVVLLGFKRMRIMGLTLSLRDTFPMGGTEGMDYNHFWKTSLYRALIAHDFAQCAQPRSLDPEEAFVAGLILEIGMLMLYHAACPEEMRKSFPGGNLPLEKAVSWEEENLGVNHREVGSLILRRWRFSADLVDSQSYFGSGAIEPDKPILCRVVELARRATEIVFGQTADLHELQRLAQDLLKLEPQGVNVILSEAFDKVEELAEQLLIEVDSQTDIVRVMENANQALGRINASMDTSLQGLLDQVGQYDRSLSRISEEMNQSRRDILHNTLDAVAHEIRNPLLAIGGFARRLAHQAGTEDHGRQYAKIIAEESIRLERILKEILEYTRAYEPALAEKDLVRVTDKLLDEFRDLFREKGIDVVRDFPEEPVRVPVDTDGISRVLRQLVKNAIGMIGQDGGTVAVTVQPFRQTRQVCIGISDNGRPMPDNIRDALEESNPSTKTFSVGLGLPMARKIIEAHNGRIELEVQDGVGNSVRFFLPMLQSP